MQTETKLERFNRLAPPRVERAHKALSLLENFGRSDYEVDKVFAAYAVETLFGAVIDIAVALKASGALRTALERVDDLTRPFDAEEPKVRPPAIPEGVAEGGAAFESEVRWALDAINRGDLDLAKDRLKRCLTA